MLAFDLLERLTEAHQGLFGNADAGVGDGDLDALGIAPGADHHLAALGGELDAVGQEVDQNLLHRAHVGENEGGFRRHRGLERHAGTFGRELDETHRGIGDGTKIEDFFRQLEFSGLDLRHVEDAVDQFEQVIAGFVHQVRIFDITWATQGAEHLLHHHFREADDGVERRAQLVAHIGKEAALGPIGLFGKIAGFDQLALIGLALGDVARHRHDVGTVAVRMRHRAAANLGPDMASARLFEPHHGGGRTAEIARIHEGGLHRLQIVGMAERGRHQPHQTFRRHPEQRQRRRTGISDAPVGGVTGDEVHRVVGQEPVHRRALGGGLIGSALTVLCGGGDQTGLQNRDQDAGGIILPSRQACRGQQRQGLQPCHHGEGQRGSTGGFEHRRAATRQRRLGGNQREPDQQRRLDAAGQHREVSDQGGKKDERSLFQDRQRELQKRQNGKHGRSHDARHRHQFERPRHPDDSNVPGAQCGAQSGLGGLNGDELPGGAGSLGCFFSVNIHHPRPQKDSL